MTRIGLASTLGWVIAGVGALVPQWAAAQETPETVRIVLPFAAGNSLDTAARALAESLHQTTRRTYVIDNKPGAGGLIGTAEVAKSKPDGSVLLYTTGGHTTNAALYKKLPYDPIKDFTPITQISMSGGFLLLVSAGSRFKSVQEFVAAAKEKPGTINYGSFGTGNTTHLVGALFAQSANLSLVHVPYKTSPIPDLIGGHINAIFLGSSIAKAVLDDGKVRALAVSGDTRIGSLPNVPTFNELGFKGVDVPGWSGIWAPAGMSPAAALQIQREVAEAMRQPDYVARTRILESTPVASSPEDFAGYVASEITRLKKQLRTLNIELD